MNDQQRAAMQVVFDKANAVEIDSDECLDFDECTAMLVPIDAYNELIEAITALREALAQPQDHSEQHLNMVQGEWVDLTEDEMQNCHCLNGTAYPFALAIIAKFKEKNTPPFAPNLNCKSVQRRLAISWGYVRKEEYDMAIEATKEKAAKVCENVICYHKGVAKLCAAAIRSMK